MKFYYTGASATEEIQNKPIFSLGGFKSSSIVPNGQISNLFGDISELTIDKNNFDIIGIILKNELPNKAKDILFHFEYEENSYIKIEVAFVSVVMATDGSIYMEKIVNSHSLPYIGDFVNPYNEANKINIGDLNKNSMIAIWFKKTLELNNIKNQTSPSNLLSLYNNSSSLPTINGVKIKMSWTDVV